MDLSVEKITKHADARGFLAEMLTLDEVRLHKGRFGHLFITSFEAPKAKRGNHYHLKQHEYLWVLDGKIKFVFFDLKSKERKEIILKAGDLHRLRVGPYVAHVCFNLSKTAKLLSYFAYPYDPKKSATVPYKLI